MNKKMYKLISLFIVFFTMFFINKTIIYADTIVCNYKIDQGADGAIDVVLTYDTTNKTGWPTVTYNRKDFISIKSATTEFKINEISSDNNGCPSKLYSLDTTYYHPEGWFSSYDSYENVEVKLYLSESSAKTGAENSTKFDVGTLLSYDFLNNIDNTKRDKCEYYENLGGTQSTSNKIVIYYDKGKNTTPDIYYNGKGSSDSKKYVASFKSSDISACPVKVFSTDALNDGVEQVTFYLNEETAKNVSKSYVTYSNHDEYGDPDSHTIKKIDYNGSLDSNDSNVKINCSDFSALHTIYLIILIIAPIIVIVLGTVDYAKAVMASNLEKMEKFKKKFPIRLAALIILFLVPLLIKFLLSLNSNLSNTMLNCVVNGKDAEIKLNSAQLDKDGANGAGTGSLNYTPSKNNDSNNSSNNDDNTGGTSGDSTRENNTTGGSEGSSKTTYSDIQFKNTKCSECSGLGDETARSICKANCVADNSSKCAQCNTLPDEAKKACRQKNNCTGSTTKTTTKGYDNSVTKCRDCNKYKDYRTAYEECKKSLCK